MKKRKKERFLPQSEALGDGGVGDGDTYHVSCEYQLSHVYLAVLTCEPGVRVGGGWRAGPWIYLEVWFSLSHSQVTTVLKLIKLDRI